jgi:integrase
MTVTTIVDRQAGVSNATLEPLLKIEEVARILGRTHWTIRHDIKAGKLRPYLTPEEFDRLLAIVDEPYASMIYVAVHSGLRVSELIGLRWEDVHSDSLTIDERYCRGDWSVTKTPGSAATIGVAPSVIERMQKLRSLEVELNWGGKGARRRIKVVRSDSPQDLVF